MTDNRTETPIKKEITDYLRNACNYKAYRMHAGRISKNMHNNESGTPDLFVVADNGFCFWVETKASGKKPSKIQLEQFADLQSRGQLVLVADCLEDVIEFLKENGK